MKTTLKVLAPFGTAVITVIVFYLGYVTTNS